MNNVLFQAIKDATRYAAYAASLTYAYPLRNVIHPKRNYLPGAESFVSTIIGVSVATSALEIACNNPLMVSVLASTNAASLFYDKKKRQIAKKEVAKVRGAHKNRFAKEAIGIATAFGLIHGIEFTLDKILDQEQGQRPVNNVEIHECTLDETSFTLIGENHVYNKESSQTVKKVIDSKSPEIHLTEGFYTDGSNYQANYVLWQNSDSNKNPIDHAKEANIETYMLEKKNKETGLWECVRPSTLAILQAEGTYYEVMGELRIPSLLLSIAITEKLPYMTYEDIGLETIDVDKIVQKEIIDCRNEKMVDESARHFQYRPQTDFIITVGKAHVKGMIELYAKQGELSCETHPLSTFPHSINYEY